MAMALSAALREIKNYGHRTQGIYSNTDINSFELMLPSAQAEPMTARQNIRAFLALANCELSPGGKGLPINPESSSDHWCKRTLNREGVSQFLINNHQILTTLNKAAQQAAAAYRDGSNTKNSSYFVSIESISRQQHLKSALEQLNHQADGLNLCSYSNGVLTFMNEESAAYLGGKWLEEWVWLQLKDLGCDDFVVGAKVRWRGSQSDNEFDALVAHNNRLLIIECKSGEQTDGSWQKASSTVYSLGSKGHHAASLFGQRLLLAANWLDESLLARAEEYNITVLGRRNTQRPKKYKNSIDTYLCNGPHELKAMVKEWMNTGRLTIAGQRSPRRHLQS